MSKREDKTGAPPGPRPDSGSRPDSGPRRLTAARLHRQALHYLERHSSSTANLRRVLWRKARRAMAAHDGQPGEAEAEALIEAEIAELQRLGYVDDRRYARARVAGLRRRGASARAIRARLAEKGVDPEIAAVALADSAREDADPGLDLHGPLGSRGAGEGDGNGNEMAAHDGAAHDEGAARAAEWRAALTHARKRRLGPWRREPWPAAAEARDRARRRELGNLARAGFDHEIARAILEAESPEDLASRVSLPPDRG